MALISSRKNLNQTGLYLEAKTALTGSNLDIKINLLSENLTGNYASITNLASTGSTLTTNLFNTGHTLDSKINNLSGFVNNNVVFKTGDQTISGNKIFTNDVDIEGIATIQNLNLLMSDYYFDGVNIEIINSSVRVSGDIYVSGNKVLTGIDLSSYATITNLALTGSTLDNKIGSLSGNLTSTYATIANLASTGSTLDNKIGSLSGNLTSTYATIANLASTGSTLDNKIGSLSGNLTSTYATIANLASTGSALDNKIGSLSGNLTSTYATIANLANTGSTLDSKINNLSGVSVLTFGNQTISGDKSFVNGISFSQDHKIYLDSDNSLIISGRDSTPQGMKFVLANNTNKTSITFDPDDHGLVFQGDSYYFQNQRPQIYNTGDLSLRDIALSDEVVSLTGNQTISGEKIFQGRIGIGKSLYDFGFDNSQSSATLQLDDYNSELRLGGGGTDQKKTISFYDSSIISFQIVSDMATDSDNLHISGNGSRKVNFNNRPTVNGTGVLLSGEAAALPITIVYTTGNQTISGEKIFNSLRIEPSGRAFTLGTGLNINSQSGIVRINTNVSSSLGAGFTYALTSGMDPNRPLDIEGRGRLVHGLSLDAGSANFTNASDHFHLFFSAGPSNPGSFNGRYSTDTNTNYKSYQFSPTTRPNGNDNLRDLIHLTTLEAKGANDQTFPTSNLTELYLTTTGTTVVTPPGTGLVELAYAINSQPTSQYLHSTGDLVYLRVFPGVAGIVANTYNGTVVTRATGLDPAYGSTNVYKVGIALGALNVNNNFLPAQRGTSTQTDAWTLTRSAPSNAFTGITRIERNSSQYLDQFNVFYTSPITGYTGESVVVDVFNRGAGTFIASGITLTQARYDGYVSKVLSPTGLEITLSVMNFGSLGGVGRPGAFHNPPLTTGSAFISSEDLITGMKILRGSSDSVHRNYWAHNVFAGFRNLDATDLNVPAGVITRVAVGGLNRVESGSTSAIGFNNKAYALNSHAYGAHQENYNRDSVKIGATTESYINIVSGKLGVNVVDPSATIDIGTGNIIAGGLFINGNAALTGVDLTSYATTANLASTGSTLQTNINNLSGYINSSSSNIVFTTGNQTISGTKTFIQDTTFGDSAQGDFLVISGNNFTVYGSGNFTSGLFVNSNSVLTGIDLSPYATTVNLASTGSNLNTQIENSKKLAIAYAIAL